MISRINFARITLFALLCIPSVAFGQVRTLAQNGYWETFGGLDTQGVPTCGVSTWGTRPNEGRLFFAFKWFAPNPHFTIQITKSTWAIPSGTQIPLRLAFDGREPWTVNATGAGRVIEFIVGGNSIEGFVNDFVESSVGEITFLSGDEGGWRYSLRGTHAAMVAMLQCVERTGVPSQPFSRLPREQGKQPQPFSR